MPPTSIALSQSAPSAALKLWCRASAFLVAGYLALSLAMLPAGKQLHGPSVSIRLAEYLASPPPPSPIFAQEDSLGPRTLLDRWNPVVREAAEKFHVPALWLRAVMRNETGGRTVQPGDRPITSSAGAVGVMQLLPETYDEMAQRHGLGASPANPRDNIFAAAAYLAWLKQRYGFPAMFAAYNFGPRNWELYRARKVPLPAETRSYVKEISAYLKDAPADIVKMVHLTRPDGTVVALDTTTISGIRPAPEGQYAAGSQTLVIAGKKRQAVRESPIQVAERLRAQGIIL